MSQRQDSRTSINHSEARDVDKNVQRIRDARKKRDQVQSMLNRGYNNHPEKPK
jgi:hypothetical protein